MLIDGTLVDSDGRIDVVNPATGEAFASAPDCTDALLDRAIEAGRRAFKGWRNTQIAQRQACLHKAADILTENAEQLARLFTRAQGRPTDAAKSEIDIAVARSDEPTSELQSLMRISYALFCDKKQIL